MSAPIAKVELDQKIVAKVDDERLVFLWMSVVEKGGRSVVDRQGHEIDEAELEAAVYEFMQEARTAKVMHEGTQVGTHVAGLVFTRALQKALGIDLDQVGWLSVVKVNDDAAWADVKAGRLAMGSIAGTAIVEN